MKFDCGETWQEKSERLGKWHDFFVLIPKHIGPHDCRWLEVIERRGEYVAGYGGAGWEWEYRAKC